MSIDKTRRALELQSAMAIYFARVIIEIAEPDSIFTRAACEYLQHTHEEAGTLGGMTRRRPCYCGICKDATDNNIEFRFNFQAIPDVRAQFLRVLDMIREVGSQARTATWTTWEK